MRPRVVKQQLGSLAYWGLGVLWRLTHPVVPPKILDRIVIINLLRIGDTVVTLPALKAVRELFPQAHISLVVRTLVEPLVRHLDDVDNVTSHDGDNSFSSCCRLIQKLPEADVAIVLDTSPWVSWAAAQKGIPKIVAYDSLNRAFAATDRIKAPPMWNVAVPDYQPGWDVPYQGEAWLKLVQALGSAATETVPTWPVETQAKDRASRWLKDKKIDEFVLIHPGSDPSYQWPVERFQSVIKQLNCPVILGGASFDRELCESIASGLKNVTLWCGEGDLADYGALLSLAQHVLSVDTSAAHLAAAVGTPLTVLFGPGDPQIWGPRGNGEVNIIQATSSCIGCKAAKCTQPTHDCMESIEVASVLEAIGNSSQ